MPAQVAIGDQEKTHDGSQNCLSKVSHAEFCR